MSATRRIASPAAAVRNVISTAVRPPASSARHARSASSASDTVSTQTTRSHREPLEHVAHRARPLVHPDTPSCGDDPGCFIVAGF